MKLLFVLLSIPLVSNAKEWKCLKQFQKETGLKQFTPSDWLSSDRRKNTMTWKNANTYNLTNNKPEEYQSVKERRDFYEWLNEELSSKGHEVIWPKMAFFISEKLRMIEAFPYEIFTSKKIKDYARQGSDKVFHESFVELKLLFVMETPLQGEQAENWDKRILHNEQFQWIEAVYNSIDERGLKKIERIAKGKGFYGLFVPKAIRFEGDISNPDDRYDFAWNKLRNYVQSQ